MMIVFWGDPDLLWIRISSKRLIYCTVFLAFCSPFLIINVTMVTGVYGTLIHVKTFFYAALESSNFDKGKKLPLFLVKRDLKHAVAWKDWTWR